MKFKLIALVLFLSLPNFQLHTKNNSKSEVLYIYVNGLVCDFCARSIEKLFSKRDSVESINLNLEKMLITINLREGKNLNNEIIEKLIKDSGYNVIGIQREK